MIYILDNLTNKEKVIFSNAIKNITKTLPYYINYYSPVKELIKTFDDNFGFCSLGGDDFITSTRNLHTRSLGDSEEDKAFIENLKVFENNLTKIVVDKFSKAKGWELIVDEIPNKNVFDKIKEVGHQILLVRSLTNQSFISDDKELDEKVKCFKMDVKVGGLLEDFEKDLKSVIDAKKESETIKIDMLTLKSAA